MDAGLLIPSRIKRLPRRSHAKLAPVAKRVYRQHVLKERPGAELVQIGGIQPAAPTSRVEEQEEVGSFGD